MTEACKSEFFCRRASFKVAPFARLLEPLIRRWPARFLMFEVGPPMAGTRSEPEVKFDGDCFCVREPLVAMFRIVVVIVASRTRPFFNVAASKCWD